MAEESKEVQRIKDLVGQLSSPLPADRAAALTALSDFVHHPDVRRIVRVCADQDADPDVRYQARQIQAACEQVFTPTPSAAVLGFAKACKDAGKCDLEALDTLLKSDDPATRLAAVLTTIRVGGDGLADRLVPHLTREKDHWVLAAIVTGIGVLGNQDHVRALLPYLRHESPRVVANAVSAIYQLSPETAFQLAAPLLAHQDNRVQGNVLMILAERDSERCVTHLRLMASSRRDAYRSTALFCLKQVEPAVAAEIALEMLVSEDVDSLARQEAALLAATCSEQALPALTQLAVKRPERRPLFRAVLEGMAKRLNWPDDAIEKHEGRVKELCQASVIVQEERKRKPGVDTLKIKITDIAAQHPQRRSGGRGWLVIGGVASLVAVGIFTYSWQENAAVAKSEASKNTASGVTNPTPKPQKNSPKLGAAMSVAGEVKFTESTSLLLKSNYVYYHVDFPNSSILETVSAGQRLKIHGKYIGWDEEAGVVRMSGTGVQYVLKSEGKSGGM